MNSQNAPVSTAPTTSTGVQNIVQQPCTGQATGPVNTGPTGTVGGTGIPVSITVPISDRLAPVTNYILTKPRLQDLVREIDPTEQLDEEVEDLLLQLADNFVESAINAACLLTKHRNSKTVEVRDVQLHLERNWNMWIPGFGTDELKPYKRATITEAHKQRLNLIRRSLKKS